MIVQVIEQDIKELQSKKKKKRYHQRTAMHLDTITWTPPLAGHSSTHTILIEETKSGEWSNHLRHKIGSEPAYKRENQLHNADKKIRGTHFCSWDHQKELIISIWNEQPKHLTWSRISSARRSILKILPTTGAKRRCHSMSWPLSNCMPSSMSMAENFAALKHVEQIDCNPETLRCSSTPCNDFSDP